MARKLSLFIEDNSVRVLLCENDRVLKWANLPLEEGIMTNGVIVDEEKAAEALTQQLKFLQIKEKWVILGISGLNSLYRIISLPQMADNLLADAVQHEAERVMPINLADVYLSYQVIPGKPDEKRIFLVAFPKITTDSLIKTIRRAGMEPFLVDLAPLALCRNVVAPRAIVTSARGANLDIMVMDNKVPAVLRSILFPTEVDTPTEKLATLAEEVERTIAFFNQSQVAANPDQPNQLTGDVPVLVTGDLVQMKDGLDLLSTRLGHPVETMASGLVEPAGFDSAQFMVNIGLILKESAREKGPDAALVVNFNALPLSQEKKPFKVGNIAMPVVGVLALAVVVFMAYLTMGLNSNVGLLEIESSELQKQITTETAEVTALKARVAALQTQVQPIEERTVQLQTKIDSLSFTRKVADEYTSEIVSNLMPDQYLTGISYNGKDILVEGTSEDLFDVYYYARDLRSTNLFDLTITSLSRETEAETEDIYYKFEFDLNIR